MSSDSSHSSKSSKSSSSSTNSNSSNSSIQPVGVEQTPTPQNVNTDTLSGNNSEVETTSSSPDIAPVVIAQPSSTIPQNDNESTSSTTSSSEKEESVNNEIQKSNQQEMEIKEIENETTTKIEDDYHFTPTLNEAQKQRYVADGDTIATLYNNAKEFNTKAFTNLHPKPKTRMWNEYIEDIEKYACGFLKHDIKSCLFCMENTESAYSIGLASILTGKCNCYVPPSLPQSGINAAINLIDADVAFIDNTVIDTFRDIQKTNDKLQLVIVGTDVGKDKKFCSLNIYFEEKAEKSEFEKALESLRPDTIAEIIPVPHRDGYHGVIWTHANITAAVKANNPGLSPEMTMMEVLPQAAFGERIFGMYCSLAYQLHVVISQTEDLQFGGEKIMKHLKQYKPKFLFAVPRVYEKIAKYSQMKIEKGRPLVRGMKDFAAKRGVDGGVKQGVGESKPRGYGLSRTIVYNKALKNIGLHKCYCSCWGVLSESARKSLLGLGITVFEGLMLPETTGFCLTNKKDTYVPGTYGSTLKDITCALKSNEIVVKGPTVSPGYCNESVNHVYPYDDGFKTSMLAKISKFGKHKEDFFMPKSYAKPLVITSNADMIEPDYIEENLKTIPSIAHCMLLGEHEKFISALFTINYDKAKEELKEKCPPKDQIRSDAYFGTYLRQKVEAFNQTLPRSYRVKKFVIFDLPDIEDGMTVIPMKVRDNIAVKLAKGIERIYHPPEATEKADEKKRRKEEENIQKRRRKEEKQRVKESKKAKSK
ncbi:AMP dependent ligase/synthetase [Entamoeba marina]